VVPLIAIVDRATRDILVTVAWSTSLSELLDLVSTAASESTGLPPATILRLIDAECSTQPDVIGGAADPSTVGRLVWTEIAGLYTAAEMRGAA